MAGCYFHVDLLAVSCEKSGPGSSHLAAFGERRTLAEPNYMSTGSRS